MGQQSLEVEGGEFLATDLADKGQRVLVLLAVLVNQRNFRIAKFLGHIRLPPPFALAKKRIISRLCSDLNHQFSISLASPLSPFA